MSLKPGDVVRIREDSEYYYQNQYIGDGVIKIKHFDPMIDGWISVTFSNGYRNSYSTKDIEIISTDSSKKEVKHMQMYKKGDKLILRSEIALDNPNTGCGNLDTAFQKGRVSYIELASDKTVDAHTSSWNAYDSNGKRYLAPCCTINLSLFTAQNSMANLRTVTDAQRANLSKENVALLELGIINDKLELENRDYVLNFLFNQNKQAIAEQAEKEVAQAKAEAQAEKAK